MAKSINVDGTEINSTNNNDSIVKYADQYNIPIVSIKRVGEILEMMVEESRHRGALCLIGHAGLGKTQIVHEVGRKLGRRVIDLRTSSFSLMGAGVPQRANDDGLFDIALPNYFPKKGERCILFFDEINQGQAHALNMLFPLLEDRRLFNYELPDDCVIVCAMNPASAQYSVSKVEGNRALNRRIKKLCVVSSFGDWMRHAETKAFHYGDFPVGKEVPCHLSIRNFLETAHGFLYTEKEADKNQQFACPATWQTVSLDLYQMEKRKLSIMDEGAEEIIGASIGLTLAKALTEFIRDNEIRISPEAIFKDYTEKSEIRKRVQARIKQPGGGIMEICDNVMQYMYRVKPSIGKMSGNLLLFLHDLPDETMMSTYTLMRTASETGTLQEQKKNIDYSMEITRAMCEDKSGMYTEIVQRIDKAHQSVEDGMTKGKKQKAPDPIL